MNDIIFIHSANETLSVALFIGRVFPLVSKLRHLNPHFDPVNKYIVNKLSQNALGAGSSFAFVRRFKFKAE